MSSIINRLFRFSVGLRTYTTLRTLRGEKCSGWRALIWESQAEGLCDPPPASTLNLLLPKQTMATFDTLLIWIRSVSVTSVQTESKYLQMETSSTLEDIRILYYGYATHFLMQTIPCCQR
jgi:hypothetical protein